MYPVFKLLHCCELWKLRNSASNAANDLAKRKLAFDKKSSEDVQVNILIPNNPIFWGLG